MARKKIEPIKTLGRDVDDLTVQKSLPLFSLWRSPLTLAEFKILDTYLARIDSHHPERRVVTFTKGELEEKLGVKKINQAALKERLKHLMESVVEIKDSSEKKGFRLVSLFEEAVAEQDEETGLWEIRMECTQKAMKYFFNVETLGYLRYKLRSISAITGRYSYIMFTYLEHNRFRKSWTIKVSELKEILDCAAVESYESYKEFNKHVLKRVYDELTEKTECRYTYEPIKSGRKVTGVRFTIETQSDTEELPGQISMSELLPEADDELELWQEPLKDFGFSKVQYEELKAVLVTVPERKLPILDAIDSIDIRRYHYIDIKVKELIRRDKELKPIKNRFSYFKKMLEKDAERL